VFEVTNIVNSTTREVHADFLKRYADKELVITPQLCDFTAHGGGAALVTRIDNHRFNDRNWELHVYWQGYPDDESTWESLQTLHKDVPVIVKRYLKTVTNKEIQKRLYNAISTRV
jgi:hypothetical protein